jgi:hypothetical protein
MVDEVFHGSNPDDAVLPTSEPLHIDTLLHHGHLGGEPRLFYSATVLTTGNGQVNADFALTGLPEGVLCCVPFLSWFSPRHRQSLKVAWWHTQLRIDGQPLQPYRVRSWCEAASVPTAQFAGLPIEVTATLAAPPGEARLVEGLQLRNPGAEPLTVEVVMSGAARPGEETGSFYDAVNGTVGRARTPNPVACEVLKTDSGLQLHNEAAGVAVQMAADAALLGASAETVVTEQDFGAGPLERSTVQFELRYELTLAPGETRGFQFSMAVANEPDGLAHAKPVSLPELRQACAQRLRHVAALETPDALLTAALRRSAAYALSLGHETGVEDALIFHSDHVSWPVDCARDTFHIANGLLLLEPELVRRHLRFHLLQAIPQAGPGKSYIGQGISCGEHEARLLDLAAYPLLELCRYWQATGDDEFVANPRIKSTIERVVGEVSQWRSPATGLLTSTERSSDEVCVYPAFIPGNMLFLTTLEQLAELFEGVYQDAATREQLLEMAGSGREAIALHAVVDDPEFGPMFAFEVGEAGEALLYDHADMPNLLSAARLGYCAVDDPIYQNTLRFIFNPRNQGCRGPSGGKYRALCDGSKTMPYSPWALGALGHLMSGAVDRAEARRLVEWLRDCLTPALQLPEISDQHTGRPVQRYWFGWPTAMLMMAYVETICGVKIGREPRIEPLIPEGWESYRSPLLTLRGERGQVVVEEGAGRWESRD